MSLIVTDGELENKRINISHVCLCFQVITVDILVCYLHNLVNPAK